VRTLLYPDQDYAHYRIIRGYNDTTGEIIQDDSLEGKDLRFTYQEFENLWLPFNKAYLIIARPEQKTAVEKILGENKETFSAWQKAVVLSKNKLAIVPQDFTANFNLAVAEYYLGNYAKSIDAFEKVSANLPKHMLWYQNEPLKAYFELKKDAQVFDLTDKIFTDGNKADSELHFLRGQILERQSKLMEAKTEFEKAVFYNQNYQPAQEALAQLIAKEISF
jgi:tetratricopeptide (TPR) repeat protein